ncbi:MAG: hypothetical protein ACHQLQ_09760 [Candidatus Acidiferrales bacterium]
MQMNEKSNALGSARQFLREYKWRVLVLSALMIVPCLWHPHIEAGDLPSHVYNAWLAQLIGKGQVPGLYIVHQWNNVLCDLALLHLGNLFGLAAAEKFVVSGCVLIFFWGVFALVGAVTQRAPWHLAPCIAMLAYGYTFNMGFLNYYVSIGLACFGLAIAWQGRAWDWLLVGALLPIVLLAHPIGFLWLVGTTAYVTLWRKAGPGWRLLLPALAAGGFFAFRWYLGTHAQYQADWAQEPFYKINGADQLVLYGDRYLILAYAALAWGILCFGAEIFLRRGESGVWKGIRLVGELYLVAFCATALFPENFRVSFYAGWIGLLVWRLTVISAIFGLCVLGCAKPRRWQVMGFAACAVFFFVFLYQDTRILNRMETQAERLLSGLPPGTKVVTTIIEPHGSRMEFITHIVDRACIGRCFSYANYEPSSGQFRIRAREGNPVVTASADDSEDMQGGTYEVQEEDLPLKLVYQCDSQNLTKLCLRDLEEGDKTGQFGVPPPQ